MSGSLILKHRFYTLLLLLCFVLLHVEVCRGQVDIVVNVYGSYEDGSKKPLQNVDVFGFYDIAKAMTLQKKLKSDMGYRISSSDFDEYDKTDVNGYASVYIPKNGYLMVIPNFGSPRLEPVNRKLEHNITIKMDEGRVLTTVTTTAKARRNNKPRPSRRLGNRKVIGPFPYYLFPTETKSNARMVIAPLVTTIETGDTVKITRPFVKDGVEYDDALVRYTGFDRSRDPFVAYRSPTLMRTREDDSLMIMLELYPIEKDFHYRVNATRWFEDFNTVYYSDSICLDEGYDIEPLRFLEYDLMNIPIQRERYKREGRIEQREDHRILDVKFVTGAAHIDPSDSASFAQLNQLKYDLNRFTRDGGGILSATIHGSTSPEGGRAINAPLSQKRAEYLRQEIGRSAALRGVDLKVTSKVGTWAEVADLLLADSLKAEAEAVRQIVSTTADERMQEKLIKELPFYQLINERALSQMRKVNFEFQYYTRRVKSREEIWEEFQNDPDYRAGKNQLDYEFYELFDMVKDPAQKEVLAKAALKSIKEPDGERPYALAAYELAQCYLKRGIIDTTLLKPYLNWYLPPEREKINFEQQSEGWFNDEAIVITQITMLCKANDYMMADSIAVNLLSDNPKYNKLKRFLDCLNGMYNDPVVRDTVAASSPWNKIVVYAAQDDPDLDNSYMHKEALSMLQDPTIVNPKDPRVLYLTAVLRYRLEEPNKGRKVFPDMHFQFDDMFVPSIEDPTVDEYGEYRKDWGYPMIECCKLDSSFVQTALTDGYFNEAYRNAFKKAWSKAKLEMSRPSASSASPNVPATPAGSSPDSSSDAATPLSLAPTRPETEPNI